MKTLFISLMLAMSFSAQAADMPNINSITYPLHDCFGHSHSINDLVLVMAYIIGIGLPIQLAICVIERNKNKTLIKEKNETDIHQ
jgi:hypothetical protein